MGIFRRKSETDRTGQGDQDQADQDQADQDQAESRADRATSAEGSAAAAEQTSGSSAAATVGAGSGGATGSGGSTRSTRGVATAQPTGTAYHRTDGPFDVTEVDGVQGRLDLGALWVTGLPGMELRLDVEQETQSLVGVTAVLGESALQMQAFAAPRTAGVWDDIRTEIAASITSQGGTAEDTDGPLGAELQARMPGRGPDGRTMYSPARFLGIDGPRWFLRGVLSGRAAVDPDSAHTLLEVLKATVVVRGDEAMAPRDMLPLRLPQEALADAVDADEADQPDPAQGLDAAGQETDAPAHPPRRVDDLRPFERGPEITEVR